MGATARAVFQAHLDGLTASSLTPESLPIDYAWIFDEAIGQIDVITLATGPNTLRQPSGATMLLLIPPPTNIVPLILKGAISDQGVMLTPNCASILSLQWTSIVVQVTATVPNVRLIWL